MWVGSGPVDQWNRRNAQMKVRKGDHIVAVNRVRNDPEAMLHELEQCEYATVRIHCEVKWIVDHVPTVPVSACSQTECAICFDPFAPEMRANLV